ncbi:MAG: YbaN family protein [Proteobacteria bacterium]|nr:YbaN family protein [Pseudomonadota bacterium]
MSEDNDPESQETGNLFYLVFAYICIGLGAIGAILPLMPTTPFLLLAAWAAPKGSPALHRWLYQHPQIGPILNAWEQKGAVSIRTKWIACCLMAASWVTIYIQTTTWVAPAVAGVLFISVATFILTRPTR